MAKDSSSSDRIGQIEERLLAHKGLASIASAVIAVLVLLPVYAELVSEPADANAGTGCWVVPQYSVNAARPGGGVYRENNCWWNCNKNVAVLPPCCQNLTNQTTLFIPYDESYAQAFRDHDYDARNYTLHDLSLCEEDDTCASCAGDAFAVEAATCAAGRCESRRGYTDGSCTCDRAYEDTQGGGRWACDAVRGCQWRRDFVIGLPGPPQEFNWFAQDKDFASLYALYLVAVAASAFGVAASLLICREFRRSDESAASTTPFRAYLRALVAYFVIQLFTNLVVFFSFMTLRCEHHNVKYSRSYDCDCESPNPTVADIVGGAWEWLDGFKGWCAGNEGSFSANWWHIYGDGRVEVIFAAMTRPCLRRRAVRNRNRRAIEQASHRWRGG